MYTHVLSKHNVLHIPLCVCVFRHDVPSYSIFLVVFVLMVCHWWNFLVALDTLRGLM